MEDSFDIYADLDNLDVDQANSDPEKEENLFQKLKAHIKILEAEVAELRAQVKTLERINNNVEQNFSSLLKTAKSEISRKDQQIYDLRKTQDNYLFRRNRRHQFRAQHQPCRPDVNFPNVMNQHEMVGNQQDVHIPSLLDLPCTNVNQPQEQEYAANESVTDENSFAYSKNSYLQRPSSDESDDERKTEEMVFKKTLFGERLHNRLMEEKEAERRQKEEKMHKIQNGDTEEKPKMKEEDSKPEQTPVNSSSDKENVIDSNQPSQLTYEEIDSKTLVHSLHQPADHSYHKVKVEDKVKCTLGECQDDRKDVRTQSHDINDSDGKDNFQFKCENSRLQPLHKNVKDECNHKSSHVEPDHNHAGNLGGQDSDKDEYVPLPVRNLKGREHHQAPQNRYNSSQRYNGNYRRMRRDEYDVHHRKYDHSRNPDDYRSRQRERSRSRHLRDDNDHRSNERSRSKHRMSENDHYKTQRSRSRHQREENDYHSKERGRSRYRADENGPQARSKSRHQRGEETHYTRQRSRSRHQITEPNHKLKDDRSSSRHRIKETNSSEKETSEKSRSSEEETKKDRKPEHKQDYNPKERTTTRHNDKENKASERGTNEKNCSSEGNRFEERTKKYSDLDYKQDRHSKNRSSVRDSSKETDSSEREIHGKKHPSEEGMKKHRNLDNELSVGETKQDKKREHKQDHRSNDRSTSRHTGNGSNAAEKEANEKNCSSEGSMKKHSNLEQKQDRHSKESSSSRHSSKEIDSNEKEVHEKKLLSGEKMKNYKNLNDKQDHHSKEKIPSRRSSKETNGSEKRLDEKKSLSGDEIGKRKNSELKLSRTPKKTKHDKNSKNCETSEDLHARKKRNGGEKTPKRKRRSNSEEKLSDPSKRQRISSNDKVPSDTHGTCNVLLEESKLKKSKSKKDLPCDLPTNFESDEIDSSRLEMERLRILRLLEADDSGLENQKLETSEMIEESKSVTTKEDNRTPCDAANKKEKTKINMTEYFERKRITSSSRRITISDHDANELLQNVCNGETKSETALNGSKKPKGFIIDDRIAMDLALKSPRHTQPLQNELEEGEIQDSPTSKPYTNSSQIHVASDSVIDSFNIMGIQVTNGDVKKAVKKVSKGDTNDTNSTPLKEKLQHPTQDLGKSRIDGEVERTVREANARNIDKRVIGKESQSGTRKLEKDNGPLEKRLSGNEPTEAPAVLESQKQTRSDEKKKYINEIEKPASRISKRSHETITTRQQTQKALQNYQKSQAIDNVVETVSEISPSTDANPIMKQESQNHHKKTSIDEISKTVPDGDVVIHQNETLGRNPLAKKRGFEENRNIEDSDHKAPQNGITEGNSTKKIVPTVIEGVKNVVYIKHRRRKRIILENSEDKVPVNRSIENEDTSSPTPKCNDKLNISNSPHNRSLKVESPEKSSQNLRKLTKLEDKSEANIQNNVGAKSEFPEQELTSTVANVIIKDETEVVDPQVLCMDKGREIKDVAFSKKSVKPVVSSQNSPKCKPVAAKTINIAKLPAGSIIFCKRPRRRPQLSDSR